MLEHMTTEHHIKDLKFNTEAQQFYQQLRQERMKVIDEGHGKRFDIIYSHLLEPFRRKLDQDHNALF